MFLSHHYNLPDQEFQDILYYACGHNRPELELYILAAKMRVNAMFAKLFSTMLIACKHFFVLVEISKYAPRMTSPC